MEEGGGGVEFAADLATATVSLRRGVVVSDRNTTFVQHHCVGMVVLREE